MVPGYTLETLLGRGGSGEVWRAAPRRGGEPVAVKVLVAGDPERQAREAALLGGLDHPHLVRLIEVVHQPQRGGATRVALVLELLAGGSLAALLARRGRLRPGEVVTAIAPVAAALAHAHGNGVVHGDLSPGNIVFTAEGRPVLTDLGVGRVLGEAAAAEVTPPYVDPTVARGGAPGPASDVFGIAAAAFHALTGIAPWNAATPADTLAVAAVGLLPDLAELAPDAPPELVAVINRGLADDPHDRGSAAAFALDLRHACRPEPVRLPVDGVPDADLGRTGRGPRTELTHQVAGRRPRPAPVIAEAPGRWARWRRTSADRTARRAGAPAVRRVALGALAVLLVGAGALGVYRLTDTVPTGDSSAETVVAAVVADLPGRGRAPTPDGEGGAAGPGRSRAPDVGAVAPRPEAAQAPAPAGVPDSVQGWRAVVAELYAHRAAAFASGSVERLADVYTEGSGVRTADEEHVRALSAAGEVLRGFAPRVVAVTAAGTPGDRVALDLVDRWADYAVVPAGAPDGPAVRTVPGRAEATVRMVLVRTTDGWRIESARRLS
ncbi:serine/threonine protein kinase [Blastococcus colisei]|uniref:non-specific serine/threonine protein kinase n=1 Tax=Blastococcus colisei TaxID=1564162 RepID=A0A543PHH7_9ACTN|nr:serine/threonine protein kinase [Blastococcus colisei]